MGIVDEDIATVRSSTDIVALISQYTQLKRSGRRWVGLCPFHAEKTPSFSVNQELGLYRCFGCQVSGDAITIIREVEQLDFVGAVEALAARAGVALRYTDRDEGASRKRRGRLVDAVGKAVEWYHDRLLAAPDAAPARRYLRERCLTGDEVRAFRLGWAPDDWDQLCRALRLPDDVIVDSGLGRLNSRGRQTDTFRARILFPIFDANGDPLAFGGRVLPGGEGPKYRNTPQTVLYEKSKVLYALNWSKARIVNDDRAIVCEGYTDVMGLARVGLPAAVAPCGTALTDDHVRLLRRYARRLVLAFDADAAGQAAAERFYEWEREHEVEVSVAELPAGVDPGDLAVSDPEGLVAAIDAAVPFLRFRVERVLGAADLGSPEGRARAAERAIAVIREHPNDLVRDQYLMTVADRCRVDPERLRAALRQPPAARDRDARAVPPRRLRSRAPERDGPELEVLRHVIQSWEEVDGWVHEGLFGDDLHAAAFRQLLAHPTVGGAIDAADPAVAELITRLATDEPGDDPRDPLRLLISEAARREVARVAAHLAAEPDDVEALETLHWLTANIHRLADPATAEVAAEQLVAWTRKKGEVGA